MSSTKNVVKVRSLRIIKAQNGADFSNSETAVQARLLASASLNRLFYHLCMGVQKGFQYLLGTFGPTIPLPSQVHEARWINTASAIMRLYIQSEDPSEPLVRLVSIIVQWYGPPNVCHQN